MFRKIFDKIFYSLFAIFVAISTLALAIMVGTFGNVPSLRAQVSGWPFPFRALNPPTITPSANWTSGLVINGAAVQTTVPTLRVLGTEILGQGAHTATENVTGADDTILSVEGDAGRANILINAVDSNNNPMFQLDQFGELDMFSNAVDDIPLILTPHTGQTADLMEVRDSTGASVVSAFDATGDLTLGNTTHNAQLKIFTGGGAVTLTSDGSNALVSNQNIKAPAFASSAALTTLTGPTAGTIQCAEPQQGSSYKVVVCDANGYENNSATSQSYFFPTAFTAGNQPAALCYDGTGNTHSAILSSSGATTTSVQFEHGTTTVYSLTCIIEGF